MDESAEVLHAEVGVFLAKEEELVPAEVQCLVRCDGLVADCTEIEEAFRVGEQLLCGFLREPELGLEASDQWVSKKLIVRSRSMSFLSIAL